MKEHYSQDIPSDDDYFEIPIAEYTPDVIRDSLAYDFQKFQNRISDSHADLIFKMWRRIDLWNEVNPNHQITEGTVDIIYNQCLDHLSGLFDVFIEKERKLGCQKDKRFYKEN